MEILGTADNFYEPDLCNIYNNHFEYVTLVLEDGKFFFIGKRRYGCIQKVDITKEYANDWLVERKALLSRI